MNSRLFKVLAVVSALVLMGGYVTWYVLGYERQPRILPSSKLRQIALPGSAAETPP